MTYNEIEQQLNERMCVCVCGGMKLSSFLNASNCFQDLEDLRGKVFGNDVSNIPTGAAVN